jgi:hypothetical protein
MTKVEDRWVSGMEGEFEEVFVVEARKFVKNVKELELFEEELRRKGFTVKKRSIVFEY